MRLGIHLSPYRPQGRAAGDPARLSGYAEAGVAHVPVEPQERALDAWLAVVERIARISERLP